jgi:hypothetical protein
MTWYSVYIENRGDDRPGMTEDEFAERLGDLVNALVPHRGVVAGGGEPVRWGGTISVESTTALTAITEASAIIRRAGLDVFLPDWPVVHAEAVREDILDVELAQPGQVPVPVRKGATVTS